LRLQWKTAMRLGVFYGRMLQMKRKNGSSMHTGILLDDAKAEHVSLVCSWFSESSLSELLYDSDIDYTPYCAWCCFGQVELVFVESPRGDYYVFSDPDAIENLQLALD